jgi:hypothetical protein
VQQRVPVLGVLIGAQHPRGLAKPVRKKQAESKVAMAHTGRAPAARPQGDPV